MTKKLEELFASFQSLDYTAQMEQIRQVRSARHIERPAAAVKRVKKEAKKKDKDMGSARGLLIKMSPEERAKMIAKLKGETGG
jgi:ribosomal protein L29